MIKEFNVQLVLYSRRCNTIAQLQSIQTIQRTTETRFYLDAYLFQNGILPLEPTNLTSAPSVIVVVVPLLSNSNSTIRRKDSHIEEAKE